MISFITSDIINFSDLALDFKKDSTASIYELLLTSSL